MARLQLDDITDVFADLAQLLTQSIVMPLRRRLPDRRPRPGDHDVWGGRVRGTLVAAGGTVDDELIVDMIHRGGGRRARALVLPAAHVDFQRAGERYIRYFTRFGMQRAESLPLAAREQANDREVAERIAAADIVFLAGGDTGLLLDVLAGTASEAALRECLRRGAVVAAAGAAAGAVGTVAVDWSGAPAAGTGSGAPSAGSPGTGSGAGSGTGAGTVSATGSGTGAATGAAASNGTVAAARPAGAPGTDTWPGAAASNGTAAPGNGLVVAAAAAHGVRPGLGLLPGCLLDRQGVQRGRLGRFLQAVAASPDAAWGLGLEEGSALVIQPGWLVEVHGQGPVLCVDARLLRLPIPSANGTHKAGPQPGGTLVSRDPTTLLAAAGAPVHVLPAGWRLDLRAAQILPPAPPAVPARTRRRGQPESRGGGPTPSGGSASGRR